MSLYTFIKDAGAKIFGGKTSAELAAEASADKQKAIKEANEKAAITIQSTIKALGLEANNLAVRIEGDTAFVSGEVKDQATKEKIILVAGNSAGIALVNDSISVKTPEPEAIFHTVVKGDTLSKIAKTVYGNAMNYPVIFEANKPMLKDPDKIYPGQVLRIPKI